MNTEVMEKNTESDQDLQFQEVVDKYEADRRMRFDKHRKANRSFPAFNEVSVGDRFTIPKGTTVMSSTLQAPIITHDDIKAEVSKIFYADLDCDNSFSVTKLTFDEASGWEADTLFGNITVDYTDLKDWHYKSK